MQNIKEIDFVQLWRVIKSDKRKVAVITGIIMVIAIIYCIFATPIFTGKVLINPPKLTDASNSSFVPNVPNLGQVGGGLGGLLQKADTDIITSILKSDAISDMLINQFNLIKRYKQTDIEYTRLRLSSNVSFNADIKSGLLEIDVDDPDPKVAAAMANFYTVALGKVINQTEYNRSKQKTDFYASQLPKYKQQLINAESALRDFSKEHRISAGEQGQVVTVLSTQLATTLADTQSRLQAMSTYATPQNPEYKLLQAKAKSLSDELDKLSKNTNTSDTLPPGLTTDLAGQYYNLVSDVHVAQEIYLGLIRRYQVSMVDSVIQQDPVVIQVINFAKVPIHKSKPKRLLILLGSILVGAFIGSIFVLIKKRKVLA